MITNYKEKKLIEYLKDGQKNLIRFGHGLGDTILFFPIFERLQKLYPKIHFDLYVESGQEEIWNSIKNKDAPGYDFVFHLDFPMSEGSKMTKPEKCCIDEIGIEPITEMAKLPVCENPFVAIHFQGTALPGSVSCPIEVASQIWQEVKDFGKIPIECHFEHCWHNPANTKYPFVDLSVRQYKASLKNLFGLLQRSWAFIGVASGPFIAALSIIPDRVLYLEKAHPLETYTKKKIPRIDIINYKAGQTLEFLKALDLKIYEK